MPTLAFKVHADWEKVAHLREEIKKLKSEMKGMDAVNSPAQFNALNAKLKQCTEEFNSLTTEAMKAGAKIEGDFKKKIYDAQQTVNGFSEDILKQKKIVADTSEDLKRLSNQYKNLRKNGQNLAADGMLPQLNKVRGALDEQKYALFELTQERAKAQLGVKKLREEYQLFAKDSDTSTDAIAKMKSQILGMGKGLLAGMGLKELGSEIIRVRGQFQQADTAIQTLLGSKERTNDLLAQVREYAKISPLEFGDIIAATQMMLGFNIEAEKVPGFIKAIGDVSMGESGKFNSLTLAFSQMSATGKLMGQDLNQMINAGFNPLQVMAEKTGKSIAQLKEEMSKGAITSEMVQQAFIDATSAGGKFFNMSENAAKTINGQISMMYDAMDSALNDIGTKSEGMIVNGLSAITKLIESYETVGRVVTGLVATYGAYRTAVALVTFAENGHTLSMTMARAQILLTQKAQALLNATMLANPYVLAATALGALLGTLIATSDGLNATERAQKNFNDTLEEARERQNKYNSETEEAIRLAQQDADGTGKREEAMKTLIGRYPDIIAKYIDEEGHLKNILQLKREIARIDGQRTYEDLQNSSKKYKDAADAARQLINGKQLSDEQKKLLADVKQEYFDKNNWQAKAFYNDKDLVNWADQMSGNFSKQAEKQFASNAINQYQQTIAKYSVEQLKGLQKALQTAKTKGDRVRMKGFADLNGAVLSQGDISSLDKYVDGLLKSKSDNVVDKKSLSDRKKKLQAELDALSAEEAAGKKGVALKKRIQAIDKQLEAYSASGKGGKGGSNVTNSAEKMAEIRSKQQTAEQRAAKDLEFSTREAEIKAMEDGTEKKLKQIELDRDKEMEAIERAYADMRQKRIDEAKQLYDADPKNKGKNFFESSEYQAANVNTADETKNYNKRIDTVKVEYQRSLEEIQKIENKALLDYLQEYGTYQQKKLAIAESYNQKIKDANTAGEKMSLQRQMEQALANLDLEQAKKNVNWEVIFNDLDRVSLEHLKTLKANLKQMLYSDDISAENAKVIAERIGAINNQIATKQKEWKSAFGLVIPELERIRQLKDAEKEAQERLNEAQRRQVKALWEEAEARKEIIDLARQQGIDLDDKQVSTENMGNIVGMFQNAGKDTSNLTKLFDKLGKKQTQVAESTENLAGAEAEAGGAAEAAGGSFASTVAIIDAIVHGINDNVQSAKELFDQMGLADTKFGKGFSKFAESSQYATDAWESLKSGNVMGVANGVYGSLRTLGEALGEWGIGGMGSSDTSLLKDMERLTESNKTLQRAIDNLAEIMNEGAVADAESVYRKQKSYLAESEKNTQELMQRSAAAYSNGFLGIGGTHSSGKKINDDISSSEWNRISQLLGKSVRSAGEFFKLTSEEMYRVANELPDIYSHIKDLANDGYQDAAQFMDDYTEYWKQLKELEDAYLEKLTSTSFDNIQSDFANKLMDMESDAETFSENFEDYMRQAIINSLVSEQYRPLLEKWYKAFGAFIKDGRIDEEEMRRLKQAGGNFYDETTGTWQSFEGWDSITQSALEARDALKNVFGWGKDKGDEGQTATSNAIQNITQDQANVLEGRITAMQIAVEQGNTKSDAMLNALTLTQMMVTELRSIATDFYDVADDTRDILANSYLELRDINEHQGKIEKAVVALQSDVQEMKNDIKDLR